MLTAVKLLKHYSIYNSGETAGFPPEKADELVKAGIAERVSASPAVETPPAPPSPVALEALKKSQLIELAKTELDLVLDPESKKDAMIAAIEAARAAKAQA
jgi:hypothetical protein